MEAEIKFMKYCLRYYFNKKYRKRINEILKKELNWSFIYDTIFFQKLSPLFYKILKDFKINSRFKQRLKADYTYSLAENLHKEKIISEIVMEFNKENIPLILLKGIALSTVVYEDIGERRSCDVDVLVKKRRLN